MSRARLFLLLLIAQALCAMVFVMDIVLSVLGFYPVPLAWSLRELMEIGALLGLFLGLIFGGLVVWRAFADLQRAEVRLDRASGAFRALVAQRIAEWGLTPAEADVALFAIKGLSLGEIAALRATSEGTVKAQAAAIYRKAGVAGRPQLLSLFIEDMMRDDDLPVAGPASAAPRQSAA